MGLLDSGQTYLEDRFEELYRRLTAQISFGVPINVDSLGNEVGQKVSEVRGSWVELTLTAASGTTTVTHNLNIPITTVTGAGSTANRLNVRWFEVGMEFGDRTGANAQPAAPGGFTVQFMHMGSSAVTPDAVTLQYAVSGFLPSATAPLYVSLFVIPAVR